MAKETKERIGFIGAGLMGHGMALHIRKNGWPLAVIAHKNRAPIDDLVGNGATEVKTLAELAAASDIVFLCVGTSRQVEEILLGEGGVLANAKEGTVVVDTGTSLPQSTRMLNQKLRGRGMLFCDSPLSRSPAMAEQGKLLSLISAEKPLFERLRPVLDAFSEIVVHVGETVGSAHEIKLLNNLIGTGYAAIWAEAYSACIASGNDPKVLHQVVSGAGMNCLNFQNFSKYPLEGDSHGHKFSIANCAKDTDYYIRFADGIGHGTVVSDGVRQLFKLAAANGYGDEFVSMLTRFVNEISGGKTLK